MFSGMDDGGRFVFLGCFVGSFSSGMSLFPILLRSSLLQRGCESCSSDGQNEMTRRRNEKHPFFKIFAKTHI